MSQLNALIGNEECKQDIGAQRQAGRWPHAVIIAAPDGCGRGFCARCLAADLLYPHGGPAAEALMRGEASDLLVVRGEGKSGQIPVDSIRAVRKEVHFSSLSAQTRVVWIRDAHRMAAPAANALLKTLEEPPAGVYFLLTVRDVSSLPLTIASRCTLYTLAPVSEKACEEALRAHLPADADASLPRLLAALYGGRIGKGLRALASEERLATMKDALAAAAAAGKYDRYSMLRIFAAYEGRADGDREKRDALLSDMVDAFDTALRGTAATPGLPTFAPRQATALIAPVQQARLALMGNAAPKITFTALVAQLAHAKAAS